MDISNVLLHKVSVCFLMQVEERRWRGCRRNQQYLRCFQFEQTMIIEHTTIKFQSRPQSFQQRREKGFEGKKIINQVAYSSHTHKHTKSKQETPLNHDRPDSETFRELLSRRDRNREAESRLEQRPKKAEDNPSEKNLNPHNKSYSKSKSRSRSKGIVKSKSLRQLGKKSKSMVRLEVRERKQQPERPREQRKSESPQKHAKSTMSMVEKKNYKSNYTSRTNRELTSEVNTDREKSKGKLKISQISKPSRKPDKPKDFKKKSAPKILVDKKKTLDKESSKAEKRAKQAAKPKKEKKVIISQENSKFHRNDEQWDSSQNQEEFLDPKERRDPREKKPKGKESNMVDIPKRKERLSLNTNSKRYFKVKNTKTEAQVEVERERLKDLQQWAATTIQKVFRGYLTRKYIRECFEHNAAINIQRVWRGYSTRRQLAQCFNQGLKRILEEPEKEKQTSARPKQRRILQHEQYLLQKSSSRQDSLRNSGVFMEKAEKWTSILQEILSEESVNGEIKKKIEQFLQRQRREGEELRSNRLSGARSNLSSQVITNEINSEKQFMESLMQQERRRKLYPQMNVFISPTNYKSPRRLPYGSPQGYLSSPSYLPERLDESRELTSSEMLISNLKNIQRFHKQRLQGQAAEEKEELNKMLIKCALTPRTHEKKYRQVEEALERELERFSESINEIVRNCILYKESPSASRDAPRRPYQDFDFDQESMITPKKELAPLQLPPQLPEQCVHSQRLAEGEGVLANMRKLQQKSAEFSEYYRFGKEQLRRCEQAFDSSYQFIEEYLINLIDFIRQFEGGCHVTRVLDCLRKPRSHEAATIMHNMSAVTEGSQAEELESSFKLPLYKYIELDQEIVGGELVDAFNQTFPRLAQHNALQQCFVKMVVECMNEALNSLRPTRYIFTQTQLPTLNVLKAMERLPLFECENSSEEEMQYQFMLAQTLNKLFYWNKLEWGKIIPRAEEQDDRLEEMRELLQKQEETALAQLVAREEWHWYQEMVEIINQLTEELFVVIVVEEAIEIAWNTGAHRVRQPQIGLAVPDSSNFFQA